MIVKYIHIVLILISINLFSQSSSNKIELRLPHQLNLSQDNYGKKAAQDIKIYHLLAVMIDFAVDQDAATYGNGKFGSHYSKDYGKTIIDPLPHDRNYFKNHLEFLRNYYLNVSGGKVVIEYEVLDRVITLPQVMSYYSPQPTSDDLSRLGVLFEEVWKRVDSIYPNYDFSQYDVFTIFHAGVGRDIIIPEKFGLEKDIPSVFLSHTTLKNFFGSDYSGVKIGNPPKYVNNSMIIPETESREIETITGRALLELSINGLLAASFASYLGLPDLFDTKTGKTAIGRFGLMDGQSIFAYAGLFPPELSAWEKYYLGWIEPVEISRDTINVEVFSRLASNDNQKLLYKITINPREYYLIENRQRDTKSDGIKIKSMIGNYLYEYHFQEDFRKFSSYYVDTVDGVVLDIDEFDWAIPGNGILIWHIDDKIISENLASNTINANPKLKGVKLIEADGIQDIGTEFRTILGDVIVSEGDKEDFWFKENPAHFYKNEFSDSTKPRSLSNNGSPTFIRIYNFSSSGNRMTFNISFGNDDVKSILMDRILPSLSTSFVHQSNIDKSKIILASNRKVFLYDLNTKSLSTLNSNLTSNVIAIELESKTIYAYTCQNESSDTTNILVVLKIENNYVDSQSFVLPVSYQVKNIFAYKELNSNTGGEQDYVVSILTRTGEQFEFYLSDNNFYSTALTLFDEAVTSAFDGNRTIILTQNLVYFGTLQIVHNVQEPTELFLMWDNSLVEDINERIIAVVVGKKGELNFINQKGILAQTHVDLMDSDFRIACGNLNKNETNFVLINTGQKIYAFNKSGAIASNFPITPPQGSKFVSNLTLIDYNDDDLDDILVMTNDGKVLCYDGSNPGKNPPNLVFEYSIGYPSKGNYSVFSHSGKTFLLSGNDSGYIQLIQISGEEKQVNWLAGSGNLSGFKLASPPLGMIDKKEFLPKSRVYNWPNPVYEDRTYFRVYVSEDAHVKIKIYDLNGDFVDEVDGFAYGGVDNEIVWNVTNIQSGIYLAKVEATNKNFKDFKIIKVAVVK